MIWYIRTNYVNRIYNTYAAVAPTPVGIFEDDIRTRIISLYRNYNNKYNNSFLHSGTSMLRSNQTTTGNDTKYSTTTPTASSTTSWQQQLPIVDEEFVRSILIELGEHERAEDNDLVHDMVQVAQSQSGLFDEEAFCNAISADIQDWKVVGNEDAVATFFEEVFGSTNPRAIINLRDDGIDDISNNNNNNDPSENVNADTTNTQTDCENPVLHSSSYPKVIPTDEKDNKINEGTIDNNVQKEENPKKNESRSLLSTICGCGGRQHKSPFQSETINIDMVIDAHDSTLTVAFIWLFYILKYVLIFSWKKIVIP